MKKRISLIVIFALIINILAIGSLMAQDKTSASPTFTGDVKKLQKLSANEKFNIALGEKKAYIIEREGINYIMEVTLIEKTDTIPPLSNDVLSTSVASAASYKTAIAGINIYSIAGLLQGTMNLYQTWGYNNGTYVYLPSPTIIDSVPTYSWPNYWSNLQPSGPTLNTSTNEYTSRGTDILNIGIPTPWGTWNFQHFTAICQITFDAYGNYGVWSTYN